MDSLNTLAKSLPTHKKAEQDLINDFKAAALSVTTLYKTSLNASKKAYNNGYAAACNDLLMMIQQGVSVSGDSSASGSNSDGMTIGKVMDFIEARMDAIKATEEDEAEDEEKERENRSLSASTSVIVPAAPKQQENKGMKNSSVLGRQQTANSSSLASSSPSPPPIAHVKHTPRTGKSRSLKGTDFQGTATEPEPLSFFSSDPVGTPPMAMSIAPLSDLTAGSKRRHHVMMMLDSPSSVSSGSSAPSPITTPGIVPTRRRTRSSRGTNASHQNQNVNLSFPQEPMDVEEDGRERKRVARR